MNQSGGKRHTGAGYIRQESTLHEKMKLKHQRGLQGKSGWKGAPNGDLRLKVPEDCSAVVDRRHQTRRSMAASGVVLRTDEVGVQSAT